MILQTRTVISPQAQKQSLSRNNPEVTPLKLIKLSNKATKGFVPLTRTQHLQGTLGGPVKTARKVRKRSWTLKLSWGQYPCQDTQRGEKS